MQRGKRIVWLTLCAECSMVSALHMSGGGRLRAVSASTATARCWRPVDDAGNCSTRRAARRCSCCANDGPVTMSVLLPEAFGPDDLP